MGGFSGSCRQSFRGQVKAVFSGRSLSLLLLGGVVAGCSSVPLTQSGFLTSYSHLGPTEGRYEKQRLFVDGPALEKVRTIAIEPAKLSPRASQAVKEPRNAMLLSNALDRALCIDLSDQYQVVMPGGHADLTVRSMITDVVPTGKVAAGVSKVATLGTSAVLPVGVPRLPIGLGGLAVEAEAIDGSGVQRAAIIWSRGANSVTNSPRISDVGDAYALAGSFAGDFADLLMKGRKSPAVDLTLPSWQKVQSKLGGAPKNAACDAYGRASGISGFIGNVVGAPPSWTDKGQKN
ncbi:DUF3313 domain-containing protein [Allorhizobium sp. BGMRC 0089]|uniref:DUF3313 domain-containing protein n=1 Tax=Allorhizobium sonneratiae TaxID=2934936 RepID=UPI002033F4B0|nr:DUF3313 domain-containing protein [Allorhizobium sonneratiae]MCM2291610.1 DUF3313 domain-containing protein [Allorhizobium sonneratiae]